MRAVGILALTIFALTACGSTPQGQVNDFAVRVTHDTQPTLAAFNAAAGPENDNTARLYTRAHEAPDLLRDNSNPDVLYLSEVELLSGDCRFYRSTDQGDSWTEMPAPRLEPFTNCGMGAVGPQNIRTELKQAADGTIYYAYHAHDPSKGGARSVLLGRSTNGGQSWKTTVIAEAPRPSNGLVQVNFEPHIAIDPNNPDRIYAMWRRSYSGRTDDVEEPPTRPWMAVSTDGGASFGEPFMMIDDNPGFDGPRPVVVGDTLYAFYRWNPPTPEGAPEDAPDPKQQLIAATSTDGGKTWDKHRIAAANDASEPVPLYDRERDVFYVVWHDNRNGDLDIFFSKSADGTRWSQPVRLNDDPIKNDRGQYYPQISLAPNGRIDVAWYDYRDDSYPPPQPEDGEPLGLGSNLGTWQTVYATHSSDGGQTWSDDIRVDPAVRIDRTMGTWNGAYFVVVPVSVASTNDQTIVAWSGTQDGTSETAAQDIYTGQVSYTGGDEAGGIPSLFTALISLAAAALGGGIALLVATQLARRRRQPQAAEAS